jgi:hypothetical protein
MDSKVVNSAIKREIWPILREAGFAQFSSRTAWRHHRERIDVLNFQSHNSYNAGVLGCTTYSFSVNLGCFFNAIPPNYEPHRIKAKAGKLLPRESECHFRGRLSRSFKQPELKELDIWYIDPKGKYLDLALGDVASLVRDTAAPWFEKFADTEYAMQVLLSADEKMGELWGFGRNPSPVRHYFIGHLALQSSRMQLAKQHLELALASGRFNAVERHLRAGIERANEAMHASCEDARA